MANPFKDFFEKTMQATQIVKKPMSKEEAIKILSLEGQEKLEPNTIMKVSHKISFLLKNYFTMYSKNNPAKGGSFYLQSKMWCAKDELMKDFPGKEKEWYRENGLDDDGNEKPEDKKGKDEKKEEKPTEQKQEAKKD
jgi:hypothetical protein